MLSHALVLSLAYLLSISQLPLLPDMSVDKATGQIAVMRNHEEGAHVVKHVSVLLFDISSARSRCLTSLLQRTYGVLQPLHENLEGSCDI